MIAKKLTVIYNQPRLYGRKWKLVGYFHDRAPPISDCIQRIFAWLHTVGNHGAFRKKFGKAENKLVRRYRNKV